jgi:hypothetical protein
MTPDSDLTRRELLRAGVAVGIAATAATAREAEPVASPAPARGAGLRIDFVCRDCGGNSVSRDAWAEWDVEAQDWVLGSAFDYAFCHDCEAETRLEEIATKAD